MNIQLGLSPLASLAAGILILVLPGLLNRIVAIYLIVIGLIGLFGAGNLASESVHQLLIIRPTTHRPL